MKCVLQFTKFVMNDTIPWTMFDDMHSGGGLKEKPYDMIYIQAPLEQAKLIFYNRFGHNPNRVTCTCCGADYSAREYSTLDQATAYKRDWEWDDTAQQYFECVNSVPMSVYAARKDVLIIAHEDIKDEERQGELPEQGYVWVD